MSGGGDGFAAVRTGLILRLADLRARGARVAADLTAPISADAEDAAQEAMLRAYRSIRAFRADSTVATWLYRIAHNVCLDLIKRPRNRRCHRAFTQRYRTSPAVDTALAAAA